MKGFRIHLICGAVLTLLLAFSVQTTTVFAETISDDQATTGFPAENESDQTDDGEGELQELASPLDLFNADLPSEGVLPQLLSADDTAQSEEEVLAGNAMLTEATVSELNQGTPASVSNSYAPVTLLTGETINNWNANDYSIWSKPIQSYLVETSEGLMRVQARDADVLIEYYDVNGKVTSTKHINNELPIFGGFFAGSDGSYYLVFGQNNYEEDDNCIVVAAVRYDSTWKRIAVCNVLSGSKDQPDWFIDKTSVPFDAGSLRIAEADGQLYLHTCHEMGTNPGDGLRHQSNWTIRINESDMSLDDHWYGMPGYVSHSFNQFVRIQDGVLYRVDHGDAYPRAITVCTDAISSSHFEDGSRDLVTFNGETGANYTGASLGGFEVSDTSLLVAYNFNASTWDDDDAARNTYVVAQDRMLEASPVVTQVTAYEVDSSVTCMTPHLVKLSGQRFLLMWAENNKDTDTYCAQFALLDQNGKVLEGPVRKLLPISDCQPILLSNGQVVWFVSSDEQAILYAIDPNNLSGIKEDNFDGKLAISLDKAQISSISDHIYTGKAIEPKLTVSVGSRGLKDGTDYTIVYKDNVEPGTATVTITGKGAYRGTRVITFGIFPRRSGWKRLWGQGSLDTMEAIVEEGWTDGIGGTVVIARNDDFKDALAASGVAGIYNAPIVLTNKSILSRQAVNQLQRLKPTRVLVAGGPGAISPAVISKIHSVTRLPIVEDNEESETGICRIWGSGSPETAAALASYGDWYWEDATAIIATNASFKDALSVAPISYAKHWPIILASNGKSLSFDVLYTLMVLDIEKAYIVGGTSAVKPYVEKQLAEWDIKVAGRKAGPTGWQTSRAVADWGLTLGLSADGMGYATSFKFPDALAGAALLGKRRSVLLLADQATQGNLSFAKAHASEIEYGYVFGGASAFSDECYSKLPK